MNQNNVEDILREKFSNFSNNYEASDFMWENIESELPLKEDSYNRFMIFIVFALGIGFFLFSLKVETEVLDTSAKQDMEVQIANKSAEKTEAFQTDVRQAHLDLDKSKISKRSKSKSSASASFNPGDNIVNINSMMNSAQNTDNKFTNLSLLIDEIETTTSVQILENLISLPALPAKIEFLKSEFVLGKPESQNNFVTGDKKDKRFSLGWSTGFHSLTSTYELNNSDYQSILDIRRSSEVPHLQYNFGLELEYDINNAWSITTGGNLSMFQDELYQESSLTFIDSIPNYEIETKTTTGIDTTIIGTAIKTTTENSKSWKYTDRVLISVPIMISYNRSLGAKSKLGFGLGLEKIFYTKIKGEALDLNGQTYNLGTDLENRYGTKGVNALLRFNFNYQLTNKWDLRFMMNYKNALMSNYENSAPIQKSFNGIGIALGSHIKF